MTKPTPKRRITKSARQKTQTKTVRRKPNRKKTNKWLPSLVITLIDKGVHTHYVCTDPCVESPLLELIKGRMLPYKFLKELPDDDKTEKNA